MSKQNERWLVEALKGLHQVITLNYNSIEEMAFTKTYLIIPYTSI